MNILLIASIALLSVVPLSTAAADDTAPGKTKTVKVDAGILFSRPFETASVIDTLQAGDRVIPIGKEGDWLMVRLEDQRLGWVHQRLFMDAASSAASSDQPAATSLARKPADPDAPPRLALRVQNGWVREAPSSNAEPKFVLSKRDLVTMLDKRRGWYFIQLDDGRNGWAYHTLFYPPESSTAKVSGAAETEPAADFDETPITAAGEPIFRARVKVRSGRVREAPTTKSPIKFGIQRGDTVSVEDTHGGWYFIRIHGDQLGWAHKSLFSLDAGAGQNAPKRIEAIRFEEGPSGEEKIIFSLNGFNPPKTFALDEQVPMVACDFLNTRLGPELGKSIPVGGDLVRKIRIGHHESPQKKVRVVIELAPDKKYSVEQVFYKKTNRYTLTFEKLGFPAE